MHYKKLFNRIKKNKNGRGTKKVVIEGSKVCLPNSTLLKPPFYSHSYINELNN